VGAIPLLQSAGLARFRMLCALMAIAGLALLATGGGYLLVTLGPLIFPAWRQLDNPSGLKS
jgi:hypothetical protein